MSELVSPEVIESAVGRKRHATDHYGRARDDKFYILHSQECLDSGKDLRQCEYSLALDQGPRNFGDAIADAPAKLAINSNGRLIPA